MPCVCAVTVTRRLLGIAQVRSARAAGASVVPRLGRQGLLLVVAQQRMRVARAARRLVVLALGLRMGVLEQRVTETEALMFMPVSPATLWDPSCFRWRNRTHCVSMYNGPNATANKMHAGYPSGLLFSAADGVHFQQIAAIAAEHWDGIQFSKAFLRYLGPDPISGTPRFVMNHGTGGNPQDKPPSTAEEPSRGCPGTGQCMRWLRSINGSLTDWEPLYSNHPDLRWYEQNMWSGNTAIQTRWDAANMLPDPGGGWAAFPTATRIGSAVQCGLGRMHSPDGYNWSAVEPPPINWGEVRPISMEIGGVAKIGDRYFVIGGNAVYGSYDMYTLSSAALGGPYTVQPNSFRLSGVTKTPPGKETMHSLGAFVQDYDTGETLISNYIMSSNVFMTPFRRPVADAVGNLRLGFWPGNQALFGAPAAGFPATLSVSPTGAHGIGVQWFGSGPIAGDWNHTQGLAVSGTFTTTAHPGGQLSGGAVGFAFEAVGSQEQGPPGTWIAPPTNSSRLILVGVLPVLDSTKQTVIFDVSNNGSNVTTKDFRGTFNCGSGSTTCEDATLSAVTPNVSHSFVLFARRGMFELYVDDMLVQYYTYGECAYTQSGATYYTQPPYDTHPAAPCCCGQCRECNGRIGIAVNGTAAVFSNLRASRMSLSMFTEQAGSPPPPPPPPPVPPPTPPSPTPPPPSPTPSPVSVCGGGQSGDAIDFGDAAIGLHFRPHTFALQNISVCGGGRTQGLVWPEPHSPTPLEGFSVWMLNLSNCTAVLDSPSTAVQLDSFSPGTVSATTHDFNGTSTLTLSWSRLSASQLPTDTTVSVELNVSISSLQPGRVALRFAATVTSSSSSVCFETMALPNLPNLLLRSQQTESMFLPYFFGHAGDAAPFCGPGGCSLNEADTVATMGEGEWQPNGDQTMQWAALWSKAATDSSDAPIGLYLGNHDPVARLQLLLSKGRFPNASKAGDTGEPAGFRLLHVADQLINSSVKTFVLDHDVVLEQFDGDWFDAAQIYRRWVLPSAEWTKAGPLRERVVRKEYPAWLLDVAFWSEGGGTSVGGYAVDLQKILGLSSQGFFWNWWQCTIGTCPTCCGTEGELKGNPATKPVNPAEFAAAASAMLTAGTHPFPYLNGRLMSTSNPDYKRDNASRFACSRGPDSGRGLIYEESYGALFPVMDPASLYWQLYLSKTASNLTSTFPGIAGVYLDQVAGTYAEPCTGDVNGSSRDAGSWARGNRRMFESVAQAMDNPQRSRAVVSESNAEAYLSSLHGYFSYYSFLQCGYVPAWQAIYGGWALNIGSVGWGLGDGESHGFQATFRSLLTTQFVWGMALGGDGFNEYYGWLYFKNASHAADREFLTQLAESRLQFADFLIHGQLLRSPKLVRTSLGPAKVCQPAFQPIACNTTQPAAQQWLAPNGTQAVVIVNFDDTAVNFTLAVDASNLNVANEVCATVHVYEHLDATSMEAQGWLAAQSRRQSVGRTGFGFGARATLQIQMALPPLQSVVVRLDPCPAPAPPSPPPSPPPPLPPSPPPHPGPGPPPPGYADGGTVQTAINAAVAHGTKEFSLPDGDIWFGKQVLQITDASDMLIHGQFNTTLWFAMGGGVRLLRCSNITVSAVSVDYSPVPYVQATIVSIADINATHSTYDLELAPRSSMLSLADGNGPGRLWGVDQELKLQSKFPATEFNSVPPVIDPVQVNASVWRMTVETMINASVQDSVTWSGSEYLTLCLANSSRVVVQDVAIHSASSFAITELDGECGHVYRRIKVVRRGGYNIASNRDVFHSIDCQSGPLIEDSEFSRAADDYINVHSTTHVLTKSAAGDMVLLAPRIATGTPPYDLTDEWYGTTSPMSDIVAGQDKISCYAVTSQSQPETRPLALTGRLVITSVVELTLNASSRAQLLATPSLLNAPPYNASPALMVWAGVRAWRVKLAAVGGTATGLLAAPALCSLERFSAAGAVVRANTFRDPVVAASVRIKSLGARILNNSFVRSSQLGIELASLQAWLEGPVAVSGVEVNGNVFINSSARRGGDAYVAASPQDTDIVVSSNVVVDCCGERQAPALDSSQQQFPCTALPLAVDYGCPSCGSMHISESAQGLLVEFGNVSSTKAGILMAAQHQTTSGDNCWNYSAFEEAPGDYDPHGRCPEPPPFRYADPGFGKVLSRGPLLVCIGSRQPTVTVMCDGKVLASAHVAAGKPLRAAPCAGVGGVGAA
jgi:hypothetical protein